MSHIPPASLHYFWTKNYPCEALVEMLTRNGDPLKRFEFAFECQSMASGDTFMQRYNSFDSASGLREALRARCKHSKILKMHIGACWNGVPCKVFKADDPTTHDLDRLRPDRAPLRIDIDLTDYAELGVDRDDVEANDLHWPILNLAIDVTKRALKDCFGMDEVVCFYSGRRGVHIWVLDERAWQMDDEARATVIEFLSCPLDKRGVAKDGFIDRTPWYAELYDELIRPSFVDMLENSDMDLFTTNAAICRFEEMMKLTHPEIQRVFREIKIEPTTAVHQFTKLAGVVDAMATKHQSCAWMRNRLHAAVLTLTWPRFDKGASTKLNHLIKAPFSVHSSTCRIAVPLPDNLTNFWPGDVPRIHCQDHEIQSAEGVLRDKLAELGTPKPWTDPTEEWYMRWAPPGIDPVLEEVRKHEEEEKRAKRRKLGIDDGISVAQYKVAQNKWVFKVCRELQYQLEHADADKIHLITRFYDTGDTAKKVRSGKELQWKSKPVSEVFEALKLKKSQPTEDTWAKVTEDHMLVLLPADADFSPASKKFAKKKLNAILERSQDESMDGHVSVTRQEQSYLFWSSVFPELVRLWPLPGLVEL